MRREACAGCGSKLTEFLNLGPSPLADHFPDSPDDLLPFYMLELAVCGNCYLVQMLEVVPAAKLFGSSYAFYTGTSPSLVRYFAGVAEGLLDGLAPSSFVAEVACNDGTLLQHFAEAGHKVLGIDPAAPAEAAAAKGLSTVHAPFTAKLAAEHENEADLVLAFNVAAHVEDPHDFFEGIKLMLSPGGKAVVEFQYLGDLIAGCQVDHVYHEHRFFYSAHTFSNLALQHGLATTKQEHTPAQGGSLRMTLTKVPYLPNGARLLPLASEAWLTEASAYLSLQPRADYMKTSLLEILDGCDGVVAGYAASAKSATLLNWCGIGADRVKWVEDTTPAKIGKYTPGSNIPIQAPGTEPDFYLVLAWNYLSGIIRRERKFLDGGGRLIVPAPVPYVL